MKLIIVYENRKPCSKINRTVVANGTKTGKFIFQLTSGHRFFLYTSLAFWRRSGGSHFA